MASDKTASEYRDLWMYFLCTNRPLETKDTDKLACMNSIQFIGTANVKLNLEIKERLEKATSEGSDI